MKNFLFLLMICGLFGSCKSKDCCDPGINTFTISGETYVASEYTNPRYWGIGQDSIGIFLIFHDLHPAAGVHKIVSETDTTAHFASTVGILYQVDGKRRLYYSTGWENKAVVVSIIDGVMNFTVPEVWVKSDKGDSLRTSAVLKEGL